MIKACALASGKLFAILPGAVAVCYGLVQAAEKTSFEEAHPESYAKLVNFTNMLLYVIVNYWPGYLVLCIIIATFWELTVSGPRSVARRKFQGAVRFILGEEDHDAL
jgi:hypothetical protein